MAVHHCQKGSGLRCSASGCTSSCTKIILDDMVDTVVDEIPEPTTALEKSLPASTLYTFESILNTSTLGLEYVSFYYSIGEHFIDAMNAELLWDIFVISPRIKIAIEKFNNNENSIVIDENLYNDIQSIMWRAKSYSESTVFKTAVDEFLDELYLYEGKSAVEIRFLLDESN